jgi:hypothetical protein
MGLVESIQAQYRRIVRNLTPQPSGWNFVTSGGGDVMLETPVVNVGVGASGGLIDVQNGSGPVQRLYYGGIGGGVGLGLVPSPIDIGFSLTAFPSYGVVYKMPAAGSSLSFGEFKGNCLFYQGGAQFGPGGSGVLMFTGANPFIINMLPMHVKFMGVVALSKAAVAFAGMNVNLLPGEVGVSAMFGVMS